MPSRISIKEIILIPMLWIVADMTGHAQGLLLFGAYAVCPKTSVYPQDARPAMAFERFPLAAQMAVIGSSRILPYVGYQATSMNDDEATCYCLWNEVCIVRGTDLFPHRRAEPVIDIAITIREKLDLFNVEQRER